MAAKMLAYSEEARRALQRGVKSVAAAVKATLGPKGRNAVDDKRVRDLQMKFFKSR